MAEKKTPSKLTCFNNKLSPVESWSVIVLFSVFSKGLARISAIQISTCVCKKLFHVYLKNMSYKKRKIMLSFIQSPPCLSHYCNTFTKNNELIKWKWCVPSTIGQIKRNTFYFKCSLKCLHRLNSMVFAHLTCQNLHGN